MAGSVLRRRRIERDVSRLAVPVALLLLLGLAGCPDGGGLEEGGSDGGGGGVVDDYPHYEGSFKLSLLSSQPVPLAPLLIKVEALDSKGQPMADYQGRVVVKESRIHTPKGMPADESFFAFYDEWGNRPGHFRDGIGGFVDGRAIFPAVFATVRGKDPNYDCELTVTDLKNGDMRGTISFSVLNAGNRIEYTEIGRSYDAKRLVAGEPGGFRIVAHLGRDSMGMPVQDGYRNDMEFFNDGDGTISPAVVPDYSAKADIYGELKTEFTFSAYGRQRVLNLWKTIHGMVRASAGGPFPVGPPARLVTFKQAPLAELSPVADIWAAPQGTYVAFQFGKLLVTRDGGKSFELVKKFDEQLKGVGHWPKWPEEEPDAVCVVAGDALRCDCNNCYNWSIQFGDATGTYKRYLCLAGHPNKQMDCRVHEQLEYQKDISLQTSWGGRLYAAHLVSTGAVPESGWFEKAEGEEHEDFPELLYPWAMVEDRVTRTIYIANRVGNQIAYSFDEGRTWGTIENNLPAADGISFMAFDERYRVLFVGTDQSGLWLGAVDQVEELP